MNYSENGIIYSLVEVKQGDSNEQFEIAFNSSAIKVNGQIIRLDIDRESSEEFFDVTLWNNEKSINRVIKIIFEIVGNAYLSIGLMVIGDSIYTGEIDSELIVTKREFQFDKSIVLTLKEKSL